MKRLWVIAIGLGAIAGLFVTLAIVGLAWIDAPGTGVRHDPDVDPLPSNEDFLGMVLVYAAPIGAVLGALTGCVGYALGIAASRGIGPWPGALLAGLIAGLVVWLAGDVLSRITFPPAGSVVTIAIVAGLAGLAAARQLLAVRERRVAYAKPLVDRSEFS